jgi:alpha-mannosidase
MDTEIKRKRKVHLICNSHIDPVWLWNWEEGAGAALSTFRTAVRFCKEYDELVFNHNEAILYKWVEEYDPQLFKEIQELVKQSKWKIMGGWYIQPDCNMPCGESFVRQITEGREYFKEKFGTDGGKTAINFDPFGHTIGLVQILKDAGYDNYIVCRPSKLIYNHKSVHDKFIKWKGYNGKSINVFKSSSYCSRLGEFANRYPGIVNNQEGKNDICVLWGVGNHGGGPSKKDLDDIREIMKQSNDEIVHCDPDTYFNDYIKNNKPDITLKKSLHSFSVGCYTSMVRVKQKHRELENKLLMCEKMMSQAYANGLIDTYEHALVKEAWQDLLFCEFHDSLPGSSIQIVENDIMKRLDHGLEIIDKLIFRNYFRMCTGQKSAKTGEYPVLVYNPHPYKVRTIVECEYVLAEQNRVPDTFSNAHVYDENGNTLNSQNEKESSNVPIDWAKKVVFECDLEPMAVNRFNIVNEVVSKKPFTDLEKDENYLYFKNDNMSVKINRNTGLIDSYMVNGFEFIDSKACGLIAIQDNCDPWGMTVDGFQKVIGRFKLASKKECARICGLPNTDVEPVHIIESDTVRTIVEACFVYKESSLCIRYTLNRNSNMVGVNLRVFSQNRDIMFKLSFPTTLKKPSCTGKTAYGRDELMTNGNENVAQQWIKLKQDNKAFCVINTGTYGSSMKNGELRMSVMRTPGYSAHPIGERQILPLDRLSPRQDIGERIFDYYMIAGDNEDIDRKIDSDALIIHQKPVVLNYFPNEQGRKAEPLCKMNNESVELVTVKKDGHKDGYVVRLFNNLDHMNDFEIEFTVLGYKKAFSMKPFEILSLYCDNKDAVKIKLAE